MPYIIPQKKLAFFFSPKSGGTSLRNFLFHVENGFPFQDYYVQGKHITSNSLVVNSILRRVNTEALTDYRRFALLRDPIQRFLSGFSNRVGFYKELSMEAAGEGLKKYGLPPNPDIETFVREFQKYRKCSKSINRHFFKQQRFIGDDPAYFEKVFRLDKVSEMVDFINLEFQSDANMPRLQTGGEKIDFFALNDSLKQDIFDICKDDIAFRIFEDMLDAYFEMA